MIAADTNLWARAILGDDPKQSPKARRLLEQARDEEGVFVPLVVLAELAWVLGGAPGWTRAQVLAALEHLLATEGVSVESAPAAMEALAAARQGQGDFPDHLIAAQARRQGCREVLTFDQKFGKSEGVRIVK